MPTAVKRGNVKVRIEKPVESSSADLLEIGNHL
jgi:hypothetical protein